MTQPLNREARNSILFSPNMVQSNLVAIILMCDENRFVVFTLAVGFEDFVKRRVCLR